MLHTILLKRIISGVISNFTIIHWIKVSGMCRLLELFHHVKLHLQVSACILLYNRFSCVIVDPYRTIFYKCNVKMLQKVKCSPLKMLHKKHMFCLPVLTGHYDFNVGNYYYKILNILYIYFCSALRSLLHWQFKWPLGSAMYTREQPAGVIVRGCFWLVVSHHMTETGSWWRQRTTKMAAIGGSNYWEGTAAKFLLFEFTGFAVTLITGVIMC